LIGGNVLERCDAACQLPSKIVMQVYSKSHANNLRCVGKRLTSGLRAHVAQLLAEGMHVGYRILRYSVRARIEADQLKRWNNALEDW
jgi:hypothetical protein